MALILDEQVEEFTQAVAPNRRFTLDEEIGQPPFEVAPKAEKPFVSNVLKQIPGGARDAIVEVSDTIKDLADFLRDNIPGLESIDPKGGSFTLIEEPPTVEGPTSTTAALTRGFSQFLTAFLPFSKLTKGLGAVKGGLTAGAMADITAFDPNDPLIMDTIISSFPSTRNAFTELLASSPDDPKSFKRFQRAIEGATLGLATEGVIRMGKALFAARKAKKALQETQVESVVAEATPRAVRESTAVTEGGRTFTIAEEEIAGLPATPQVPTEVVGGVEIPKFAGNVNLNRLATDRGTKLHIKEIAEQFPKNRTITDEELVGAAESMGYTLERAERLAGTLQRAKVEVMASRQVSLAAEEAATRAKEAYNLNPSRENLEAFSATQQDFLRAFQVQKDLADAAGFTLRSFSVEAKAVAGKPLDREINRVLGILKQKGKLTDDILQRLAALDKNNPTEVAHFLNGLSPKVALTKDKIFQAWMASILSGPQTHFANMAGNLGTLSLRPFERIGAATIDLARGPFSAAGRERFFLEGPLDMIGMITALPTAARSFLKTFSTGITTIGTKIDIPPATRRPQIAGVKGAVIESPLRALLATDEFFKAMSRGGDLFVKGYRSGVAQGKSGAELFKHVQDMRVNPTQAIKNSVDEEAAYRTFTKQLGTIGQTAIRLRDTTPGVRYVIPFITTPVNIAKFGLERTPLKMFDFIRMARQGKFPKGGEFSDEAAKLAVGAGLTWWLSSEVAAGNITGNGPVHDPAQMRALRAAGWQPQSIKIGDKYVSYARVEPFATMIATIADGVTVIQSAQEAGVIDAKTANDLAFRSIEALSRNVTDKTFLQGLGDMSDVLHDPERFAGRFLEGRARGLVPSVVGQAAQAQDPLLRETRPAGDDFLALGRMFNAIKSRLPKIGDFEGRQDLLPLRDAVFGEPIEQTGNFWYRYLVPARIQPIEASPAAQAMADLKLSVQRPDSKITVPLKSKKGKAIGIDRTIQLNDQQYDRYQELAGQLVRERLEPVVAGIGRESEELQKDIIRSTIRKARKDARLLLMNEFQGLADVRVQ